MEEQVTRLVDKAWEKFLQTPPDRRLCESNPPLSDFLFSQASPRDMEIKLGRRTGRAEQASFLPM